MIRKRSAQPARNRQEKHLKAIKAAFDPIQDRKMTLPATSRLSPGTKVPVSGNISSSIRAIPKIAQNKREPANGAPLIRPAPVTNP
ncbi:hypothetical protein TH25_03925 [Thalassospira profundimaris]|uniref:Uncharacterized protein n=2 Tax=Thalassospira profundimaris TaxID=502049 RepID=A0A367XJ26_9PROT|nr:hypothetical protein TH25_03925 [Thalassospira profundimaris]